MKVLLTDLLGIENCAHYANIEILKEGRYNILMATNPPKGDGHRNGAVKQRSQTYNPKTETWIKRDTTTGRFMDGKKDGTPFKGVRKEK